MEKISDYGVYTDGMRKSMADKTWFLDKIDGATEIVDYGCADGALLQYIYDAMPGVFDLVGIDIDEEMLNLAADRLNDSSDAKHKVLLTQPEPYRVWAAGDCDRTCLNCSSVIHEVYSYGTNESVSNFWDFVFNTGFKYIAIRDMALSKIDISVPDDILNDAFYKILAYNSSHPHAKKRFDDFLRYSHSDDWHTIIHYLLKYRYVANWDREMLENYLPLLTEEILLKIPINYRVKYYDHYTLPFLKDKVMEDFGINLTTKTHYKLLLERID